MILSASRRCDIPTHYTEWFLNRVREGFALARNPVNPRQVSRIDLSTDSIDCIVFWTKNPGPMLPALNRLEDFPYYFQYTLNGYGPDIEPGLPGQPERIESFRRLAGRIGPGRVMWRYDPILLSGAYTVERHIDAFSGIARALRGHTRKVILSFVDFYAKIHGRMRELGASELTPEQKRALAGALSIIAREHDLAIESCAEDIDLDAYGIGRARCIDDRLIERIIGYRLDARKDPNQRLACGCVQSVDIGAYNCCAHGCLYCYANHSPGLVARGVAAHDPASPLLTGNIGPLDQVRPRNLPNARGNAQIRFILGGRA